MLLLDEPLSALDVPTREALRGELRGLLRSQPSPVMCVTHDSLEALTLADEVAVVAGGRIVQVGPPDEVFSRPVDAQVAAIVGVDPQQRRAGADRSCTRPMCTKEKRASGARFFSGGEGGIRTHGTGLPYA